MIIDYGRGIVMDAVKVEKYLELGNPDDMGWTPDFEGLPGIRIEREKGRDVKIFFNGAEERNKAYEDIVKQICRQG